MVMNRTNVLRLVHFSSTAWFVLGAACIFILALWQAGFRWWAIFSLSGYSALIIFFLVSLYLFAIFKGISRSQQIKEEHPLTNSVYYSFFYNISPFLGTLAGVLGAIGVKKVTHFLVVSISGTLWATFLVWIIVDPAAGLIEMLLPSSRKHRQGRLAEAKARSEKAQSEKRQLLADLEITERLEQERWEEILRPFAEELAALPAGDENIEPQETKMVDIGIKAWQMGGLNCMRQLHSMSMDICVQRYGNKNTIDHIPSWWDGIGNWRVASLSGK